MSGQLWRRLAPLGVLFALDGVVIATWAVRVPRVKADIGATAGQLGLALLCATLGSLLAMPVGARLCRRYGSHRVTVAGAALQALVLPLPATAGTVPGLGLALLAFGIGCGIINVGLNSAAVDVETATGRTVMSTLHGLWSLGGLIGALLGGAVAGYLSPLPHLLLTAAGALLVTALVASPVWRGALVGAAGPVLAPEPIPDAVAAPDGPPASRPGGGLGVRVALLGLGVVALGTAYGEGSMADWGALHLSDDLRAGPAVAAYGFAAYSVTVAAARLGGDRLVGRVGRMPVLVAGACVAAVGMLVAAWSPSLPLTFAGYMLFGLGVANAFPIAIALAGGLGGPAGVATASTIGYAGQLGGPPLIGFLADAAGLPAALSTSAALAALVAVLGLALWRTVGGAPGPRPAVIRRAPPAQPAAPATAGAQPSMTRAAADPPSGDRATKPRADTGGDTR